MSKSCLRTNVPSLSKLSVLVMQLLFGCMQRVKIEGEEEIVEEREKYKDKKRKLYFPVGVLRLGKNAFAFLNSTNLKNPEKLTVIQ